MGDPEALGDFDLLFLHGPTVRTLIPKVLNALPFEGTLDQDN